MFLNREPVLTLGLVNALVALAVGFGLDIDAEQQALIHAAVSALVAWVARSQVTPTGEPPADAGQTYLPMLLVFVIGFILGALCYANGLIG